MKNRQLSCLLLLTLVLGACSKPAEVDPRPEISYAQLLDDLFDPMNIMRPDLMPTRLISSYDRTGGNNDYSHFLGQKDGYEILADIEGPGIMTRFWFTGAPNGSQPLRIYFDGEETPQIETTVGEFCGGAWPHELPMAAYENYCWYNLMPVPFKKRMVITMPSAQTPKLYYQFNISQPPEGKSVSSWTPELWPNHRSQLDTVAAQWEKGWDDPSGNESTIQTTVMPGEGTDVLTLDGPAVLTRLEVSLPEKNRIDFLRDALIQFYYDGQAQPSVQVPLGDFFGVMWKPMEFQSRHNGMKDGTLVSTFPAPFASSLRIRVVNQGTTSYDITGAGYSTPMEENETFRYLHAAWRKSPAAVTGRPHEVLSVNGRGHYAGCFLSVMGLDKSWWILESDESMYVDGESAPSWQGTGLEDYFSGGWYYQNALPRPYHGLVFKAPFRTIQYRLHGQDPVQFESSFRMEFEKGPEMRNRGVMESVAWYYLDAPAEAVSDGLVRADRGIPQDPMAEATIMHEILNLERMDDFTNPPVWIDHYLAQYPQRAERLGPVLEVRKLAYRAQQEGIASVAQELEGYAGHENKGAAQHAGDLLWLEEDPLHALLGVYANFNAEVYLDGRRLTAVKEPRGMMIFRVKLGAGHHTLGLKLGYQSYPSWVQVSLMNRDGIVGTSPDWKFSVQPEKDWSTGSSSDTGWAPVGGTGVKGPPEAPYIWLEPNGFPTLQSATVGIRVDDKFWPNKSAPAYVRHKFTWPPAPKTDSEKLGD